MTVLPCPRRNKRRILRIFTLPPAAETPAEPNFYNSMKKIRLRQQLESLAAAVAEGEGAAVACQTAIEHTTAAADAAGLAAAESLAAAEEEEKHPVVASLEIVGSLASKCLLSKVGMETHYRSFCHAVKLGLHDQISSLTKVVQKEVGDTDT